MTRRERIQAALQGGQPDRVPVTELYINQPIVVELAKRLSPEAVQVTAGKDRFGEEPERIIDLYCLVVNALEFDATCTNYSIGLEVVDEDTGRDQFGTVYHLSPHGEPMPVDGPVDSLADLRGFEPVSRLHRDQFAPLVYTKKRAGDDLAHWVVIVDPFKVAWRWRGGMQNLLMDYVTAPDLAHALARLATDFDLASIDMAADLGADALVLPGDLAGEEGTLMSPAHFREFIKPCHAELVDRAHRRGLPVVKHTDGNAWPLLDDFLDVGFDGFHPVQPQCMDIGEVKAHLRGKACVLGNIDCRDLLVSGTPGEVRETVRQTIAAAAPGGGYILTSSNSLHPGCKPENIIAMVEAAHEFGAYPGE